MAEIEQNNSFFVKIMKTKLFSKNPRTFCRICTGAAFIVVIILGLGFWFNTFLHTQATSFQREPGNGNDAGYRAWLASRGARTTSPSNASSGISLGYYKPAKQYSDGCVAFGNITLNNTDTIDNAYMTLISGQAQGSDHDLNTAFHLWDADNVPLDSTRCIAYLENTAANLTANSTSWVLDTSNVWNQYDAIDTPDFNAALAEVVDRPGWSSGNNIVVIAYDSIASAGNYWRNFYGYDPSHNYTAVLTVYYTTVVPEFTPWTLALTVAGAFIVVLVVRRYAFAPKKVKR